MTFSIPMAAIFGCSGPELQADEISFFQDCNPLGFILFGRNCVSPSQIKRLTHELRSTVGRSDTPILIDQEGGRVQRLPAPPWRKVPSPAQFRFLEQEEATIENKQISELRLACVARKIEVTTAVHTTGAASGPRRYAEYDRVEMVVYPNPFNSHAVININLPDEESIDIEIYNAAGHRIHQLASRRPVAGNYSVVWNGRDRQYMPVASGMYWIHVRSARKRLTQSLVLLR